MNFSSHNSRIVKLESATSEGRLLYKKASGNKQNEINGGSRWFIEMHMYVHTILRKAVQNWNKRRETNAELTQWEIKLRKY